jgi:hypothetical protein
MNKLLVVICALLLFTFPAAAKKTGSGSGGSHLVRGHLKKDGTYVQPHHAKNPNNTQRDNWSSKPNVNPYNGKPGLKEPHK